jgi:hypothetical protein
VLNEAAAWLAENAGRLRDPNAPDPAAMPAYIPFAIAELTRLSSAIQRAAVGLGPFGVGKGKAPMSIENLRLEGDKG